MADEFYSTIEKETYWDLLLPGNVSEAELEKLESRSILAAPDKTRVEKYNFRGAN